MWCAHHHVVYHHDCEASIVADRKWVPEILSLADAVISNCAKILGTSVDELKKMYEDEASDRSKGSQKFAASLLEFCCFKALHAATQNRSFLKDKQFRLLSFEMMLAWETPDSVAVCFKKFEPDKKNQQRKNDEDKDLFYSTFLPLLVHQRSTIGKEAFVRIAPAIPGVADLLSAHFLFDALARSSGGRLPFRVYDKYLKELDKALDKVRQLRKFRNNFFLDKGENVVEVEENMASAEVLQHVGESTQPGRLILTDHSLYFEPAIGMMGYDALQKWNLAADLKQVVEPCTVGPWTLPFFNRAISYKSVSNDEPVILEFPEFLDYSRRDYWLLIIQEILYTHEVIRNSWLESAGLVEALSRSVMSIIRFKAMKTALRVNPPRPKLLLYFTMLHVSPGSDLPLRFLLDKLKKKASVDSQGGTSLRRLSYARSATYALYNSKSAYPRRKRVAEDERSPIGEFFLDEIPRIKSVVVKSSSFWSPVHGSEIITCGDKADNLSINFAIIKAVFLSLRPAMIWGSALLSWDEPSKTIGFILLGSAVIMGELLQYLFALMFAGMAAFILFFKQGGDGPLSGTIDILSPSQSSMEEMQEIQAALNGLEELLKTSNIIFLRLRALMYSVFPKVTDQVVMFLMALAVLVTIFPAKMLLLLIFWEITTRKLPLRQENSELYMRRVKAWWHRIPIAPVYLVVRREYVCDSPELLKRQDKRWLCE